MTEKLEQLLKNLKLRHILEIHNQVWGSLYADSSNGQRLLVVKHTKELPRGPDSRNPELDRAAEAMIGRSLLHGEITEKLGKGGMGPSLTLAELRRGPNSS